MKKITQFLRQRQSIWLALAIITVGLVARVYQWQNYAFGFDQVQMVQRGQEILSGDQILIGPKTGGGDMYIGPLSYYFTAFFLLLAPMPYTLILMANVWNLLTGAALYFFSKDTFSQRQRFILLSLWAFSPFIIEIDRIPWNPSSLFFATVLVIFPLLRRLNDRPWRLMDGVSLLSGIVIATNSHFSGFMLPIMMLIILVSTKKISWKTLGLLILGSVVSVLPLLIFDLRNNWLNVRGVMDFLFFSDKVDASAWHLLVKIIDSFRISIENSGKVIFFPNQYLLNLFTGFALFFGSAYYGIKHKHPLLLGLMTWVGIVAVLYGFYSGAKPEYYYLIQFPAVLMILTLVLDQFLKQKVITFGLLFFAAYSLSVSAQRYLPSTRLEIGNAWQVAKAAIFLSEHTPISTVTYDMQFVHSEGLRYLLGNSITLVPDGQELHLIYPGGKNDFATQRFGEVLLWLDPRTDPAQDYVSTPTYILHSPKEFTLLLDKKVHPLRGNDLYSLFVNGQQLGSLAVIERPRDPDFFEHIDRQLDQSTNQQIFPNWHIASVENDEYLLSKRSSVFLLAQFDPQLNLTPEQQQTYLEQIGIMLP